MSTARRSSESALPRALPPEAGGRRRVRLELALLAALIPLALFLWTRYAGRENRLRSAELPALVELARQDPRDGRVQYHLGLRLREGGDLPAALEAFKKAADARPDSLETWRAAAETAAVVVGSGEAVRVLSLFATHNPNSAPGRAALAALLEQVGDTRRADAEARAALKLDPDSAEAWRVSGQVALAQARWEEGEKALRRALELDPADARARARLGDALAERRDWAGAAESYRLALRLAPDDPIAQLSLARALIEAAPASGDVNEAAELLERSAARRGDIPVTHLYLGRCAALRGDWNAALLAFERAARLDPASADTQFHLARAFRRLGREADAARAEARQQAIVAFFDRCRALQSRIDAGGANTPGGRELRLRLAREMDRGGRWAAAYELYRHLAEQMPGDRGVAEALAALAPKALPVADVLAAGEAQLRAARYPEAVRSFLGVLKRDDSQARAWEGAGLALSAAGRTAHGVKYLAEAARRDPGLVRAQLALGQANLDGGFSEEARRRLEPVTRAAPDNAAAWNLLGRALRESPHTAGEAEAALSRAAALRPDDPAFLGDLADLLADNNRPEAAESGYRALMRLTPKPPPEVRARYAALLSQHFPDRLAEAERLLAEVLAENPRDDFARYHLGRIALERGDEKAAIRALERVTARADEVRLKEVWYALSRAYRRAGDSARADQAARAAARMQARFDRYNTALSRLSRNQDDLGAHLEMARAGADWGEHARALKEYAYYLKMRPGDAAARAERAALEAGLRKAGRMPSMELFESLLASSTSRGAAEGKAK